MGAGGKRLREAGQHLAAAKTMIAGPLEMGVDEAKNYQLAQSRISALGMGSAVNRQAEAFARDLKTYGTSQTENLALMREALSAFGDLGSAKIATPVLSKLKFAHAALYGKEGGEERDEQFLDMLQVIGLRDGMRSAEDFNRQANRVEKVIGASGGRVGAKEWRQLVVTGGPAVKSLADDAFYYQLPPLLQAMGGAKLGSALSSAYANIYQGSVAKPAVAKLEQYGLVSDRSKVKFDRSGQVAQISPGAVKGADLYRQSPLDWVEKVLIPTLAKEGMTQRDQILDAIDSIFSSREGGDFISRLYLQRREIRQGEHVASGQADIDTLDRQAKGTSAGKELRLEQQEANLKLRLGRAALPLYVSGLNLAANALERLNGFIDRYPRMAKIIGGALAGVTLAISALAPVLSTVGLALSSFAVAAPIVDKLGVAARLLGLALGPLSGWLSGLGQAVLFLGRALALNPVGLILTAIAGAAYLVYANWSKLGPWVGKIGTETGEVLKAIFYTVTDALKAFFNAVEKRVSNFQNWLKDSFVGQFFAG